MPASPQPRHDELQARLVVQRTKRKKALEAHKETVFEFSTQMTPSSPSVDPKAEPTVEAPPTNETGSLTMEDGFAALRAQRERRKRGLDELKKSAAHCKIASQRTVKMGKHVKLEQQVPQPQDAAHTK